MTVADSLQLLNLLMAAYKGFTLTHHKTPLIKGGKLPLWHNVSPCANIMKLLKEERVRRSAISLDSTDTEHCH